jgi:predicted DCC family thiol-disulfide oxidoreductase YuxK
MPTWRVKLLYDGACPFCRREVEWLKRRDRHGNLAIEDISDPAFDPGPYGLTKEEVMGALHGVLPDGRVVRGLEAVRRAYRAIGLGWLVAPTGWPVVGQVCDQFYGAFAHNRIRLGRLFGTRCESDACVVAPGASGGKPAAKRKRGSHSWIRVADRLPLLPRKGMIRRKCCRATSIPAPAQVRSSE